MRKKVLEETPRNSAIYGCSEICSSCSWHKHCPEPSLLPSAYRYPLY